MQAKVEEEKGLREQKHELRKVVLARRDALTVEEQEAAEGCITEKILSHPWYRRADILLGFASYGSELRTDGILRDALREGKKLFLPKIIDEGMFFFQVEDLSELTPGFKGIREPSESGAIFGGDGQADFGRDSIVQGREDILMLMPGVAFDSCRRRIGYGKGFYDRFLDDMPVLIPHTVGICHRCQMVEEVPCGELDLRPAQVICV